MNSNNTEYGEYIKYINENLKILKPANHDFDSLFDSLIKYCFEYNYGKFGQNYLKTKSFVHIKGGSSIKYKMNKKGLPSNMITNDIDLIMVPFEDNPEIRIKLIEEFVDGLKKKFDGFSCTFKNHGNKLVEIYINCNKIFDIVFYDKISPWYKEYDCDIFSDAISKLKKNSSVDDYFMNLKILFESDLNNFKTLEKVTFTPIEFDKFSLILILEKFNRSLNNIILDKMSNKKEIADKIKRDEKKLYYINFMLINN